MSKQESKIQIADAEDVARYAPESSGSGAGSGADAAPTDETAAGVGPATDAAGAAPQALSAPEELANVRRELEETRDKLLRAKAESQNIARRAVNERLEAVRFGNAELCKALLPVLDDFERTLQAAELTDDVSKVVEGIRLIYRSLSKVLGDVGVEPIEALHQAFDPARHEAVMQKEDDEHAGGTVIDVLQIGYTLRDRVLRPSKVVVSSTERQPDRNEQIPAPSEPPQTTGSPSTSRDEERAAGDEERD